VVSKLNKGDEIVHGILPNIYEILAVSLPNYKYCVTNDVAKIPLKFKRFTSTMDPILIVLLKLI